MKTSKKTLFLFMTVLLLSICMQAQHTEIVHDSDSSSPQLQLTETVDNDFARLYFRNSGDLTKRWTLAARSGSNPTLDDFGLYYNGSARWNFNEASKLFKLNSELEVADYDIKITGSDPDLILSSSGTNDPAILFGDNGGTGDSRIWYDSSDDMFKLGTSTTTGDVNVTSDGKVGINEDNEDQLEAQLTIKANAGNTVTPSTLDLAENNNSGYPVLRYTNFSIPGSWTAEANSSYSSAIAGAADYLIRFSEDGSEDGKKDVLSAVYAYRNETNALTNSRDERVGIRTGDPLVDLHLIHKNGVSGHGFRIEHEGNNNHWWKMYVSDGNGTLSFRNDASPASNVGTFATNGTYTASDLRLKRDIEENPYGLNEIMKMDAKTYHYKTDKLGAKKSIGFIAQDINAISPELVLYDSESDQFSLNYGAINVIAVQAIQDQQEIISQQADDIKSLKSEMASLKAIVQSIGK